MEELAIEIRPSPTLKPAGFCLEQDSKAGPVLAKVSKTR
jgi:hypothetical protein